MTRLQLRRRALELSGDDRIALALELVRSLEARQREEARRRILEEETEHYTEREVAIIESWFEGPSEEMTDADWAEIMNTGPEDVDPNSLAVPPGWKPKPS